MMRQLDPDEFDALIPPWKDFKPGLSEADTVTKLEERVRAAEAAAAPEDEATRAVIVAAVVAVGNYEYLGPRRAVVLDRCNELLDEFGDPEHSWRWG
jgi:hypothetical protein